MDSRNCDLIGDKCVRNYACELTLSDAQKMNAWVEHHKRLANVKFNWSSESLLFQRFLALFLLSHCHRSVMPLKK